MIEGVFYKKNIVGYLCSVCGMLLILMFSVFNSDGGNTKNRFIGILLGVILCALGLILLSFYYNAFIRIDNNRIFARYNWFNRFECNTDDVIYSVAQNNTLTIVLKNGKRHNIGFLENSYELHFALQNMTPFDSSDSVDILLSKLNSNIRKHKKGVIFLLICVALMLVIIFATVLMTGGKDMKDFSNVDSIIFAVMSVAEIIVVIAEFYIAKKTGKKNIDIEYLRYKIKRTVIETYVLPIDNVKYVYSDAYYTARAVVAESLDKNGFYYIVEQLDKNYNLNNIYKSDIYADLDALPLEYEDLLDITDKFQKQDAENQ